jgi:hypothetical protein
MPTKIQSHTIRLGLLVLLLVCSVRASNGQESVPEMMFGPSLDLTGTWESLQWNLDIWVLELKSSGTTLTGKVSVNSISEQPTSGVSHAMEIYDAKIDKKNGFEFKVKSPDGMRVITFSGPLGYGTLKLTRKVEILQAGGSPGGEDIFGAAGPSSFVITRVKSPDRKSSHIDK